MILNRIWLYIFATMCTTAVIAMDARCQGRQGIVHLDASGSEVRFRQAPSVDQSGSQVVEVLDCRSCDQLRIADQELRMWAEAHSLPTNVRDELYRRPVLDRMVALMC
jgi:hypothetical protein